MEARSPLHQPDLFFSSTIIPTGRADGGYLVIPGKAVEVRQEMSVRQAAALLGYSESRIRQLAKMLGARQRVKGGKLRIPAEEVVRMRDLRA